MEEIKIDQITGSRRLTNYLWALVILCGGIGFFIAGLSSYYCKQLFPLIDSSHLIFLPQGIIMTFYGTIGILISVFIWYTIILNVGSGYNEYNHKNGLITIFRLGFPGKNRVLKLTYKIENIRAIKMKIEEGLSPKQEIYLKTKDRREIPLTKVGEPISLNTLETNAMNIAKFLGVNLEVI